MVVLAMMTNYFKLAVLLNNYFSAGKSALTKHNLAVAYNAGDMIIHGTANDSKVSFPDFCFVDWAV